MEPTDRLIEDEGRARAAVARARTRGPRLTDEHVTLAHGAGGKASAALVEQVFLAG